MLDAVKYLREIYCTDEQWYSPPPDIVAPALCTPSGDPRICGWAETLPGQVAALCVALGQVERTIPSRKALRIFLDGNR